MLFCLVLFFYTPLVTRFCSGPRLVNLSHVIFLDFLFKNFKVTSGTCVFGVLVIGRGTGVSVVSLVYSKAVKIVLTLGKFTCCKLTVRAAACVKVDSLLGLCFTP